MKDPTREGPLASVLERRAFIRNAGAALSASVAASTAAVDSEPRSDPAMGRVEEEIRGLHHTFVECLNGQRYAELRELFARSDTLPPRVAHFHRVLPESVLPPVHDYLAGHKQHLDTVDVAPDLHTATARFHCLTRMEAALRSTHPLIEMARQQGEGAIRWWESGVLEATYVRSASGWRISGLAFRSEGQWS
ncbi:MAG TPA: nuclear transport factor 2 family protein [Steroidobacteraceae bacterium]